MINAFNVDAYYLHKRKILSLLNETDAKYLDMQINSLQNKNNHLSNLQIDHLFVQVVLKFVRENNIKLIEEDILLNNLQVGQVTAIDRTFFFRGLTSGARDAYFHVKLPEHNDFLIDGYFSADHTTCVSSFARLTGRSRMFIVGRIDEVKKNGVRISPILMGDRVLTNDLGLYFFNGHGRVVVDNIESFKKLLPPDKHLNIEILKSYSEDQIKRWFAEILNEPYVPEDWGGEYSDLVSHVVINGKRLRAAFIFKGPSKFHPMTLKDLGKNADQIQRLFQEAADIYILQHCHVVRSAVQHTMEAFASRIGSPKLYCIIDGFDTVRILRGYGKI